MNASAAVSATVEMNASTAVSVSVEMNTSADVNASEEMLLLGYLHCQKVVGIFKAKYGQHNCTVQQHNCNVQQHNWSHLKGNKISFNSFYPDYDFLRSYPFYSAYNFLCSYSLDLSNYLVYTYKYSYDVTKYGPGHFRFYMLFCLNL